MSYNTPSPNQYLITQPRLMAWLFVSAAFFGKKPFYLTLVNSFISIHSKPIPYKIWVLPLVNPILSLLNNFRKQPQPNAGIKDNIHAKTLRFLPQICILPNPITHSKSSKRNMLNYFTRLRHLKILTFHFFSYIYGNNCT